jgi:serine/threonine protein kinase
MVSIIGKEIDNYRILEMIGQGGMGVVYKAMHVPLKRPVAIKMIHPMLTADQAFARRFRKEAQALARLDHKHIVTVLDFRETEYGWMIVMNYIEGITLADKIAKEGILPLKETLNIMKQSLSGIDHAHSCGFIHHDIKPRNLMISSDGTVRLTDFGLARADRSSSGDTTLLELTSSTTTAKGGTIYYMSPEQIRDPVSVDIRTDIYSIGIAFYEMLTGRRPFDDSDSDYEIQTKIIHDKFPPPHRYNPGVPRDISKIVMKAMQKDREQRFKNAGEMFGAIRQFEESQQPGQPSPPSQEVKEESSGGKKASLKTEIKRLGQSIAGLGKTVFASIKQLLAAIPFDSFAGGVKNIFTKYKIAIPVVLVFVAAIAIFLLLKLASPSGPSPGTLPLRAEIAITVLPDGARVWIDGNETNARNLADLQLESGRHRIYASLKGFAVLSDSFEVRAGDNPPLTFHLQLSDITVKTGQIRIDSDPRGAIVYMDGVRHGRTPLNIPRVEAGRHKIGLILRGYEDFSRAVRVKEEQILEMGTIKMAPVTTTAELRIKIDPEGASIFLNGRLEGVSDGSVLIIPNVAAGEHRIKVSRDGYKTIEEGVVIVAGQPRGFVRTLTYSPGELNLSVTPGAAVLLNDEPQKSEADNHYTFKLSAGKYKLTVKHPNLGTWEKNVVLKADQALNVKVDFNEEVTLIVLPEGDCKSGKVYIDGKYAGFARTELRVRVGMHTVEMRSEGCKSVEGVIKRNFERGEREVQLEFTMEKI